METNALRREDIEQLRKDWDLVFAEALIMLSRQQRMTNEEIIELANGKSKAEDLVLIGKLHEAVGVRLDIARMKAHVARLLTY